MPCQQSAWQDTTAKGAPLAKRCFHFALQYAQNCPDSTCVRPATAGGSPREPRSRGLWLWTLQGIICGNTCQRCSVRWTETHKPVYPWRTCIACIWTLGTCHILMWAPPGRHLYLSCLRITGENPFATSSAHNYIQCCKNTSTQICQKLQSEWSHGWVIGFANRCVHGLDLWKISILLPW